MRASIRRVFVGLCVTGTMATAAPAANASPLGDLIGSLDFGSSAPVNDFYVFGTFGIGFVQGYLDGSTRLDYSTGSDRSCISLSDAPRRPFADGPAEVIRFVVDVERDGCGDRVSALRVGLTSSSRDRQLVGAMRVLFDPATNSVTVECLPTSRPGYTSLNCVAVDAFAAFTT